MDVGRGEELAVRTPDEVVLIRQAARKWAVEVGFSIVDQTKIVTAASELARNAVIYGGGGTVSIHTVTNGARKGLRMIFTDKGPGIPDVAMALKDGYTTGSGLGLGLGGSKRLMNELEVDSRPGEGTTITTFKWK
jgi:serine/threonine-protein kinase RsbT